MPLISCPECGRDVSEQAADCPQCGHPIAKGARQRVRTSEDSFLTRSRGCADLIIWPVIGLILLFLLFALLG